MAVLSLLATAVAAHADFGRYESHVLEGQSLSISTTDGVLRIRAHSDSAFEVHYAENGIRQLPSFAIAGEPQSTETAVSESDDTLTFSVDGLTAVVHKSPVTVRYLRDNEPLVAEEHGYFAHETVRGFRFALEDDEKILGGGQRVLGMDRRGHRLPLYNRASYGYTTEASQMYYGLPAIMSSEGYIVAFDNTARGWLDIASTEPNVLQFEAVGGRTAYLVVASDTYPLLIDKFTALTGRQPLPPRWAFGNYASRFGYRTEREAREVVEQFRRDDIPLDAVILDLYWFGPEIQGHMGNLDWDRDAFPTPGDMVADFLADGVRTIPITEPFVLTESTRWDDAVAEGALASNATGAPKTFDFFFGNTGLIDVFDEDARDWFWQAYKALFDIGVAGTWGDLGEPEVHPGDALHSLSEHGIVATGDEVHNAFGHTWARLVYENQVRDFPDVRPVVLMRSGFLGSQRYGMMPWTGDVSRSWGGLKPQVELTLQMGLFGLAYTHSDLGGFAGGDTFDSEMYLRWLQFGVFQPIYRPHAQEAIAPEPIFHDSLTKRIARDFIRLRYALLPYVYTLAYENSTTGMPLMRPLFFENEDDAALIDEKDTYLWGDAFLIKPVTDPGVVSVEVPLPDGVWFDFWDDSRYEGGSTADVPVSRETIPVLVRAGSFVPMAEVVNMTDAYSSQNLTVHYYADETVRTASGYMYEDDGASRSSIDNGDFELLSFAATSDGDRLTVEFAQSGGYKGMPERRDITLVVHNVETAAESVSVNGTAIPVAPRLPRYGAAAAFDKDAGTLNVRFNMLRPTVVVGIDR